MKKVEAIIKPFKLDEVKEALSWSAVDPDDAGPGEARATPSSGPNHRVESRLNADYKEGMRKAMIFMAALAFSFISCTRQPYGTITHRGRDGHPDQWVSWIDKDTYQISIDASGEGRPNVVKTYKDSELVKIEKDRNLDGKVDLVQEYSHGVLVREIHDDDFDGKPETIKTFRPNDGTLAIVEHDPDERGAIDIMEFYDKSGRLARREVRGHKNP